MKSNPWEKKKLLSLMICMTVNLVGRFEYNWVFFLLNAVFLILFFNIELIGDWVSWFVFCKIILAGFTD